jgi:hypothetical protein
MSSDAHSGRLIVRIICWNEVDYKFKTFTGILNTSLSYNAHFVFEDIALKIHFVSEILPTSVIRQFFRTFFLLKSIFFKYNIFSGDLDLRKRRCLD